MSYTVLARKYRPRNFSEMVGQSHVVQALTNALLTQRLHHAYLFTGTRGVGKTTVSRILAKSLNCVGIDGQSGVTAEPCGQCDPCRDIDAGRFVDYTELDAASNRGVDEVQSLLEQAVYKPVQGRYKVFMIDEVHMLTNTAFNAMLKTLEEPPEYLKFVLATTDPQKVPVTVLSRCLQFNLRPMPSQTVVDHLAEVLQHEQVPFEAAALIHLGGAARGSMRDALSLTDQAIAYGQGAVRDEAVRAMLGVADHQHVIHVIDALSRGDGAAVVTAVDQMRVQGHAAAASLEAMAAVLQRMAICQLAGIAPDAEVPHAEQIAQLSQRMAADETQLLYSLCLQGRAELGLAVDEYAGLVMVLLRLLAFKPQAWGQVAQAEKKTLNHGPSAQDKDVLSSERSPSAANSAGLTTASPRDLSPSTPTTQGDWASVKPSTPNDAAGVIDAEPATSQHAPSSQVAASVGSVDRHHESGESSEQASSALAPWEDEGSAPVSPRGTGPLVVTSGDSDVHDRAADADSRSAGVVQSEVPVEPQRLSPEHIAPLQALVKDGVREMSTRLDEPAPDAVQREPQVQFTPEGDFWAEVVDGLLHRQTIAALARELALQSQLVARDEGVTPAHWLLRVESASLNQAGAVERLRSALADAGYAIVLAIELGVVSDTPGRRIAAVKQRRLKEAEALLRADAGLAVAFQQFGGTIVPGSLRPKDLPSV